MNLAAARAFPGRGNPLVGLVSAAGQVHLLSRAVHPAPTGSRMRVPFPFTAAARALASSAYGVAAL